VLVWGIFTPSVAECVRERERLQGREWKFLSGSEIFQLELVLPSGRPLL
jgi:hypothetical protein